MNMLAKPARPVFTLLSALLLLSLACQVSIGRPQSPAASQPPEAAIPVQSTGEQPVLTALAATALAIPSQAAPVLTLTLQAPIATATLAPAATTAPEATQPAGTQPPAATLPPLAAGPTEAAPTALPPLAQASPTAAGLVQIGFYNTLYLRFDPAAWDIVPEAEAPNNDAEPIQGLQHKLYAGCRLHANLGHGAPDYWKLKQTTQEIGGLLFNLEKWKDTRTGEPVLIVYVYNENRIELLLEANPDECARAAEAVLAASVEMIAAK